MRCIEGNVFTDEIAVTIDAGSIEAIGPFWVIVEFLDIVLRLQQTYERLLGIGENALLVQVPAKILFAELVARIKGLNQKRLDAEGKEMSVNFASGRAAII